MCVCVCLCVKIWIKYNDLTVLPHWSHGVYREIIPFYGRKIQVSELLRTNAELASGKLT